MRKRSPIVTWSISIVLALFFAAQGLTKFWGPSAVDWANRFLKWGYPKGFHSVVGLIEVVSGLALLLPWSRKGAAVSLTVVMAGAIGTHLIHGELLRVIPPLILGMLALLLLFPGPILERRRLSSGDSDACE